MSNTTLDKLFEGLSGGAGGGAPDLGSLIGLAFEPAASLASTVAHAVSNTSAPATANNSGSSAGSTILSIASTVLESGLGLVPLVSGLLGLFGGGGSPAPPPLVKYAMPERINFTGADTGSGISDADYDQMGLARAYSGTPNGSGTPPAVTAAGGGGATSSGSAGPQITVNVQAMDSQSFLDHSADIAQAVRQAMLNLNPINDVVNEL